MIKEDNYYQPFIYAGDRKFNEGDTEEAIEYYDHALNIKPLSSVYLKKSIVYKYAFDFDASIESYIIYMKNARMSPENASNRGSSRKSKIHKRKGGIHKTQRAT